MIIRPETNREAPIIEAVILTAFSNHPNQNSQKGTLEHLIVYKLRQQNALALSLIATENNSIIGHIAFSPITIDGTQQNWFVMAPVSVLPDYQNKGIGSQLIEEGLKLLKERNANGCVVLGEPNFYTRFGFQQQSALSLENASQEYFMAKTLNAEEIPTGKVELHSAFNI